MPLKAGGDATQATFEFTGSLLLSLTSRPSRFLQHHLKRSLPLSPEEGALSPYEHTLPGEPRRAAMVRVMANTASLTQSRITKETHLWGYKGLS